MKKGMLYFFAVPFIMILVAFTCTKDEGPDCHKRITMKMRRRYRCMLSMSYFTIGPRYQHIPADMV